MTLRSFSLFIVGVSLVACSGETSSGGSGAQLVGTWGSTETITQTGSTTVDATYFVFEADKTVRTFFRHSTTANNVTTSLAVCGSGTYVLANGLLSTTVQRKSSSYETPPSTITETVNDSSKIEFIDESIRLTRDVDGASVVATYKRGTLPDGLEASCPR